MGLKILSGARQTETPQHVVLVVVVRQTNFWRVRRAKVPRLTKMDGRKRLYYSRAVTSLLFASLSVCFLVQVNDQVAKFLSGEDVAVAREERPRRLRL